MPIWCQVKIYKKVSDSVWLPYELYKNWRHVVQWVPWWVEWREQIDRMREGEMITIPLTSPSPNPMNRTPQIQRILCRIRWQDPRLHSCTSEAVGIYYLKKLQRDIQQHFNVYETWCILFLLISTKIMIVKLRVKCYLLWAKMPW